MAKAKDGQEITRAYNEKEDECKEKVRRQKKTAVQSCSIQEQTRAHSLAQSLGRLRLLAATGHPWLRICSIALDQK